MLRLSRNLAAIAVSSFSVAVTVHGAAPKNSAKPDPGRDAVRNVLRAEVTGPVDRRAQLANAIETMPDSAIVHWQAGYVRAGSDWRSFEDSARTALSGESLLAYRQQRARAQRTSADQLKLADWCRARNLPDQERSHLVAALVLIGANQIPKRSLMDRLFRLPTIMSTVRTSNSTLQDRSSNPGSE